MACRIYVGVSPGLPLMIEDLRCNQYRDSPTELITKLPPSMSPTRALAKLI